MITVHRPFNRRDQFAGDTDESTPRKAIYHLSSYHSVVDGLEGEKAAEKMFHIFNAPEECLKDDERVLAEDFRSKDNYSLSVGDVVEVDGEHFLCESFGWKKFIPEFNGVGIQEPQYNIGMIITKEFIQKRKLKLNDEYIKVLERVSSLRHELDNAQANLEDIIVELEQLDHMKYDEE